MEKDHLKLLFGEKGERFCKALFSLKERFPKLFPNVLFAELGSFLSNCSENFLEQRDLSILSRVLFAHHRLIIESKEKRPKVAVRILEINPSIYGIVVAHFSLLDEELFNERHILKGIYNLIPGIKNVPSSYFSFRFQKIPLFYLEIKKMRGGTFSPQEKNTLLSKLGEELQHRSESLSQSLIVPGNEEEIYKKIRHLSAELRLVKDTPQVMITFVGYRHETLKFLVIALRIVKPTTPSILSLSAQLPSVVTFSLEHILHVDKLRKKYPKEATVFTLEMQSAPFSRNNSSVNLHAARHYIVKALENMFGSFRDYNGGLLTKENEQLLGIKHSLEKKGIPFPCIDDLFYGIKPSTMRALVSVQTGTDLVVLFQKMATQKLETSYLLEFHVAKEAHLAIIKTKEKEWKTTLPQRILKYSSLIGCTTIDYDGETYLCFFHQNPTKEVLFEALQKEMLQNSPQFTSQKTFLKINFQGGDPPSLNPRLATDVHCHTLSNFLFEGLTRLSRDGHVEPAAAEKISISSSQMFYTFTLRHCWWSNGEEVTAYHFEKAWKKALLMTPPGFMCPDFFSPIKNAKKIRENKIPIDQVGIHAKDSRTLCVELEFPCPYFLNLLATPPFFPLFGDAEEPSDFNGPFVVAEWKRDRELLLSQNPFYWEAHRIKIGGIRISMVREPDVAYQMFQKGELDIIGDPISPLPVEILKEPEIQKDLVCKSISRVFWIHCNTRLFPMNNANLRRALSLALDRKLLVEKVFIKQIPHASLLPPKYSTYKGNGESNLQEARFCFEKALKELDLDPETFPPLIINHSDLSFEKSLMEELKRQWKETLGISLILRQLQWSEFSSALEKGNFQLGGLFRRDVFNDPMFYLSFFQQSPNNPHGWDNLIYEQLLEDFCKQHQPHSILQKIEELLIEQVPAIPLVNQQYLALVKERVHDMKWFENGCVDLKEVYFHEANDSKQA